MHGEPSVCYMQRLAEAGIEARIGSRGDSYDNALAEMINGLYKAELVCRWGLWKNLAAVGYATLEWVEWFSHRRLLGAIGNVPLVELGAVYCLQREEAVQSA